MKRITLIIVVVIMATVFAASAVLAGGLIGPPGAIRKGFTVGVGYSLSSVNLENMDDEDASYTGQTNIKIKQSSPYFSDRIRF